MLVLSQWLPGGSGSPSDLVSSDEDCAGLAEDVLEAVGKSAGLGPSGADEDVEDLDERFSAPIIFLQQRPVLREIPLNESYDEGRAERVGLERTGLSGSHSSSNSKEHTTWIERDANLKRSQNVMCHTRIRHVAQ